MNKRGAPAQRKLSQKILRAITITGSSLCAPLGVASMVVLFFAERQAKALGVIPGDLLLMKLGFGMLVFGLIGPFAFWTLHMAVELWVNKEGNWYDGEWGLAANIMGSIAYTVLSLGLFAFALVGLMLLVPDNNSGYWASYLVVFVGLILAAVALSAVAGGYALFRWPGIVVGLLLGAGFCLLVGTRTGLMATGLEGVAISLMVLGGGGFYVLRGYANLGDRPEIT